MMPIGLLKRIALVFAIDPLLSGLFREGQVSSPSEKA